jgi:Family of unknown function (DUF6524)
MQREVLSWQGILLRFLGALVLVYASYNPEGYSLYHWTLQPVVRGAGLASLLTPFKVLALLLLVVGWAIFVQATRRSLGTQGALLVVALLAAVVWMLTYWGLPVVDSSRAVAHVVLLAITILLTVGMSWSHVTRRLSGQVDMDEVD